MNDLANTEDANLLIQLVRQDLTDYDNLNKQRAMNLSSTAYSDDPILRAEFERQNIMAMQAVPRSRDDIKLRAELVQRIQQAGKQIDPIYNIFADKKLAWAARAATSIVGTSAQGFIKPIEKLSLEEQYSEGLWGLDIGKYGNIAAGFVGEQAFGLLDESLKGSVGAAINAGELIKYGVQKGLNGLTGNQAEVFWDPVGTVIADENGKITHTFPKFGSAELFGTIRAAFTEKTIEEEVATLNAASEYQAAQRNGFQSFMYGASQAAGMLGAFGGIGGSAMAKVGGAIGKKAAQLAETQIKANTLFSKGLVHMATLGKGTYNAEQAAQRATKMMQAIGEHSGQAFMQGMYEAVVNGDPMAFFKTMVHGAAAYFPMIYVAMKGKQLERVITRPRMSAKDARQFGDYVESTGLFRKAAGKTASLGAEAVSFGTMFGLGPELIYNFIQNPTAENFGNIVKNIGTQFLALGAVKATTGRTPYEHVLSETRGGAEELLHMAGQQGVRDARKGFARKASELHEKAATSKTDSERQEAEIELDRIFEDLSSKEDQPILRGKIIELGEASRAVENAKTPHDRAMARERFERIQKELDEYEMGVPRPEEAEAREIDKAWEEVSTKEDIRKRREDRVSEELEKLEEQTGKDRIQFEMKPGEEQFKSDFQKWLDLPSRGRAVEMMEQRVAKIKEDLARSKTPEDQSTQLRGAKVMLEYAKRKLAEEGPGAKIVEIKEKPPQESWARLDKEANELMKHLYEQVSMEKGGVFEKEAIKISFKMSEASSKDSTRGMREAVGEMAALIQKYKGEGKEPIQLEARAGEAPADRPGPTTGVHGIKTGVKDPSAGSREYYEGMPEGPGGGKIKRFSDIQAFTERRFKIPLRSKYFAPGISKKQAAGYFDPHARIIVSAEAQDVVNHYHELGHAILKDTVGLNWIPKDPDAIASLDVLGKELMGEAEPAQGHFRSEGFAEFFARYMLGDPGLATAHPELWNQFHEEIVNFNRKTMKNIRDLKRETNQYLRMTRAEAFRSQIRMDTDPKSKEERIQQFRDIGLRTRELYWNDFARLQHLQESYAKAAGVDPRDIPITQNIGRLTDALRLKGRPVADHFFRKSAIDFEGRVVGPSLLAARKIVGKDNFTDLILYNAALTVVERNRHGIDVGIPARNAAAFINSIPKEKLASFNEGVKHIKEWTNNVIDYYAELGGLGRDAANLIKDTYDFYSPFARHFEDAIPVHSGGKRGVAEPGMAVKRLRGSEKDILDPLQAMLRGAETMISRGHRSYIMRQLVQTSKMEGMGGFAREVAATKVPNFKLGTEEVIKHLKKQASEIRKKSAGKDSTDLADTIKNLEDAATLLAHLAESYKAAGIEFTEKDLTDVFTYFSTKAAPTGPYPIVAVPVHWNRDQILKAPEHLRRQMAEESGTIKWLELDADVYKTLMSLDVEPVPQVLQAMTSPLMRLVKWGATGVNIPFMAFAAVKDMFTYPIYTKAKDAPGTWIPGVAFAQGLLKQAANALGFKTDGAESARLFYAAGGLHSGFIGETQRFHQVGRASVLPGWQKARHYLTHPRIAIGKAVEFMERYGSFGERTLRIEEFHRIRMEALKAGKTPEEARLLAAEAAQEITLNFARGGLLAHSLNQFFPYFKAGVAGQRKLARALVGLEGRDRGSRIATTMGVLAKGAASMTAAAVTSWLLFKDEDWWKEMPAWRKYGAFNFKLGDQQFMIPGAFETHTVFAGAPLMILDAIEGELGSDAAKDVAFQLAKDNLIGWPFIPVQVRPLTEALSNRTFWGGEGMGARPIVPDYMEQSRRPEDQYTRFTTEPAKFLGKLLGMSPAKIEHAIGGYTGGMGVRGMQVLEGLFMAKKATSDTGVRALPILGTILKRAAPETEFKHSRSVQELYQLKEETQQDIGSKKLHGERVSPREEARMKELRKATAELSELGKKFDAGKIDRETYDRQRRERAVKALERVRRLE